MNGRTISFWWLMGLTLACRFPEQSWSAPGNGPSSSAAVVPNASSYTLISGSTLLDDCLTCGRPSVLLPLQGTFRLRLTNENPLFAEYAVEDIHLAAGSPPGRTYAATGQGWFRFGGEVALRQEMFLALWIDDGNVPKLCYFTNSSAGMERSWPIIEVPLYQTNGTLMQTYSLDLTAAPFKEIWFSTAHNFHAGIWSAPTNFVSAGDLISSAGRVVRRNQALTAHLGIMPIVPDLGLDAVDVLPGGEIVFSIPTDVFSETLGSLRDGDLLSERGRVAWSEEDLLAAFSPLATSVAPGLDAVQVVSPQEVYFSIRTDVVSQKLGRALRRGDLLSSAGVILKTNEELVAAFHPLDPKKDYGLDAIHVWPSGEVWFSVEQGFSDLNFQSYRAGDLLSDRGYVVFRNLDLLAVFQPLEDLADFGLDALFLVTDPRPDAAAAAPQCLFLGPQPGTTGLQLQWQASGRVFQLEKAAQLQGPWVPISPVTPTPVFEDAGALLAPGGFYRLQQW